MNQHHKLLLKAIHLLEEIAEDPTRLSIQQLARKMDLSYASTYRIVHTYLYCDWLHQTPEGDLHVSPNLPESLDRDLKQRNLKEQASQLIDLLAKKSGLTAKLSVRQDNEAVSLYRKVSTRPTAISAQIGSAYHLAGGSSGATLLSGLPDLEIQRILKTAPPRYLERQHKRDVLFKIDQIRETGVCLDHGQFHPDLHTLSTVLRDRHNRIVAAVTLMGFQSDFSPEKVESYLPLLRDTSRQFAVNCHRKEIEARKDALAS